MVSRHHRQALTLSNLCGVRKRESITVCDCVTTVWFLFCLLLDNSDKKNVDSLVNILCKSVLREYSHHPPHAHAHGPRSRMHTGP